MSHPLLPKNLNRDNALFRQGKPDYSKLDVDAFPTPTAAEQGAILEVTDTGDRYRWTSTTWIKIVVAGKAIITNIDSISSATISSAIVLNATTSTVILVANSSRKMFHVVNISTTDEVWVKLQAASIDNDMKGILLLIKPNNRSQWSMPSEIIYTGEISAIAATGTPNVYITEY